MCRRGCVGLRRLAGRAFNASEAFAGVEEAAKLRCVSAVCRSVV